MCSINEAEEELAKMQIKAKPKNCSTCMKCGEKSLVLVRARDPLCRNCFLEYFTHKFRATLGKAKVIRQDEKVLVAFSGGPASCCMLNLIKEGLSENVHKKLRFYPEAVFINEGEILDWTANKSKEVDESVVKFCQDRGFQANLLKISSLEVDDNNEKDNSSTQASSIKIKDLFQSIKTLTAKQDLLNTLRVRLLLKYAKDNNFTKILVAETSTNLSMKLLSNIALGRGGSLPIEIGVVDWRDKDVGIVRPMRELTTKEVAFYNNIESIEPVSVHSLDTMEPNNASLQKQTEAFISNLQASFPSTVSTIFRTGDKLSLPEETMNQDSCILCKVPIMERENVSSDCQAMTNEVTQEDVTGELCYACQLTFKDMKYDISSIPAFAIEEIRQRKERSSGYIIAQEERGHKDKRARRRQEGENGTG
eukprot:gene8978-9936_t